MASKIKVESVDWRLAMKNVVLIIVAISFVVLVLVCLIAPLMKKIVAKYRHAERDMDGKFDHVVDVIQGGLDKADEVKDRINENEFVEYVQRKIHGENTIIDGNVTQILGTWAVEIYDADGKLFKEVPLEIPVSGSHWSIGFGLLPKNDVILSERCRGSRFISRFQAYLDEVDGKYILHDLKSSNGMMNQQGEKMEEIEVKDGTEVYFAGLIRLRFRQVNAAGYYKMTSGCEAKEEACENTFVKVLY